jgi:menaquinone-dependent protoporphyrinogen oxidase
MIALRRPSAARHRAAGWTTSAPLPLDVSPKHVTNRPQRFAHRHVVNVIHYTSIQREEQMENRVLVAYATKYGATTGIAEKIGKVLVEAGLACDVKPVDEVADLSPYDAVVLGSAVYIGGWRKEAATFLQSNEAALAVRQVWLFSSGPTGSGDPVELMKGWRFPTKLQPIADRIGARDIAVFHGAADPEKLNFMERWMLKNVKAPIGDFRDWEAIDAWAATIADAVKQPELHLQ